MKIEVTGDALKLLRDFIKYGKIDPEAMAAAMMYDLDGFNRRRNLLEKALNEGMESK